MASDSPFVIVRQRPRRRGRLLLLFLLWTVSIAATWLVTSTLVAPGLGRARSDLSALRTRIGELESQLETQRQRVTVLERSDQISRNANEQLQETLAERDEELSALRTDVAFYERLAGGTAQRQGLTVHSLQITPGAAGDLQYEVTLTQNLKKGGKTEGQVSFEIEGLRSGKLATLDWATLRQGADAAPQAFSFRYFQQIQGSVMLPQDFTPQRVRVFVQNGGARSERMFEWAETLKPQGA